LNCLFLILFAGVVDCVIPNSRNKGRGGRFSIYNICVCAEVDFGMDFISFGCKKIFFLFDLCCETYFLDALMFLLVMNVW
jgi:hypothetical protein